MSWWSKLRALWASVSGVVDGSDVLLGAGLSMVAFALWDVSQAAAVGVPGVVLVWLFLPARPPFIGGR